MAYSSLTSSSHGGYGGKKRKKNRGLPGGTYKPRSRKTERRATRIAVNYAPQARARARRMARQRYSPLPGVRENLRTVARRRRNVNQFGLLEFAGDEGLKTLSPEKNLEAYRKRTERSATTPFTYPSGATISNRELQARFNEAQNPSTLEALEVASLGIPGLGLVTGAGRLLGTRAGAGILKALAAGGAKEAARSGAERVGARAVAKGAVRSAKGAPRSIAQKNLSRKALKNAVKASRASARPARAAKYSGRAAKYSSKEATGAEIARGVARGAAKGAGKGATFPFRHPVKTGQAEVRATAPIAAAGGTNNDVVNYATLPGQAAFGNVAAAVEHPTQYGIQSAKSLRDIISGTPAAIYMGGKAGYEALPLTGGDTESAGKLLDTIGSDYSARYGPLLEGDQEEFQKRLLEGYQIKNPETGEMMRVPGGGATPFLLDAMVAGKTSGQIIGGAARKGALGARAERFMNKPRPAQQLTGDVVKERRLSGNIFTAPVQKGFDRARGRLTERRATGRSSTGGDAIAQVARDNNRITPLLRGHQAKRVVAGKTGRAGLEQRSTGAAEVGAGLLREAARDLNKTERRGWRVAVALGIKDANDARNIIPKVIENIKVRREMLGVENVTKGWDNIPEYEALLADADQIFTPALAKFAENQRARGVDLADLDPSITPQQAAVRAGKQQADVLGVTQFKKADPYEFEKALNDAAAGDKGVFLDTYSADELSNPEVFPHLYLSDDGNVGSAVKMVDGEPTAVAVFNKGSTPGAGSEALDLAIANGATRLEALGDDLRKIYEKKGWNVKDKYPFDPKLAPDGWQTYLKNNPGVDKTPNLYVMEHGRAKVQERLNRVDERIAELTKTAEKSSVAPGEGGRPDATLAAKINTLREQKAQLQREAGIPDRDAPIPETSESFRAGLSDARTVPDAEKAATLERAADAGLTKSQMDSLEGLGNLDAGTGIRKLDDGTAVVRTGSMEYRITKRGKVDTGRQVRKDFRTERGEVEYVPINEIEPFRDYDHTPDPKMVEDIRENGIREPLILHYGQKDGKLKLGEGNNRLAAAKAAGLDEVPVRVTRQQELGKTSPTSREPGTAPMRAAEDDFGHVPGDLKPSEVGIGRNVAEEGRVLASELDADGYRALWDDEDPAGQLADHTGHDVSEAAVRGARERVYQQTQRALEDRKMPENMIVWRVGEVAPDGRPQAFSYKPHRSFEETQGIQAVPYRVNRKDVLADADAISNGEYKSEMELTVRSDKVTPAQDIELGPADPTLDFLNRLEKVREREGLAQGGYTPSQIPRNRNDFSVHAVGGQKAVAAARRYTGKLWRLGIENTNMHIMAEGFLRNIKRATNWNLVSDIFEATTLPWSRNRPLAHLLHEMDARGLDESNLVFVNVNRFRHFDTDDPDLYKDDPGLSMDPEQFGSEGINAALAESTLTPAQAHKLMIERRGGSTSPNDFKRMQNWALMDKAAFDELTSGMKTTAVGRVIGMAAVQKPSRWILGSLNIPWLKFQVMSNAVMTGLVGGVGPGDWVRAANWYRNLPDAQKKAISPYLGDGSHFFPEESKLGAASTNRLVNAYRGLKETAGGKVIWAGNNRLIQTRDLNPFNLMFGGDRAQNNFFRRAVFYNSAKREAFANMGNSSRELGALQNRIMGYFDGPPEKQMQAILNDPEAVARHAEVVDEVLGNYSTFTAAERNYLKRSVMFYSFLRFSLRLAFYTMPVKHPVMTGILGQLGKLQAAEVQDLLGSDILPYALGRVYSADGKTVMDFTRANPVMNALSQTALGGGLEGKWNTGIGLLSPWIGSVYSQIAQKDAFTGKPWLVQGEAQTRVAQGVGVSDRARIFLNQASGMFFPVRLANQIQREGMPVGHDSLPFDQRPTQYSDETMKDIRAHRDTRSVLATLFNEVFPELPAPARDKEIARALEERLIEERETLGGSRSSSTPSSLRDQMFGSSSTSSIRDQMFGSTSTSKIRDAMYK